MSHCLPNTACAQMWRQSADKARELGSWLWEDEVSLRVVAQAWSHPQMREHIKLLKQQGGT